MTRAAALALVAAALAVAACGKRGPLEKPEGAVYPQPYPAPETVVPQPDEDSEAT